MPLYEYACPACGHLAEIRHGFDDRPELKCEECGAGPLQRRFSAAPIVFKGSGFYVTDSRGKSEKSASKPAASESTTEPTKPEPPKTTPPSDGGTKKSSEAAA